MCGVSTINTDKNTMEKKLLILLIAFVSIETKAQCSLSQAPANGTVFVNDASIGTSPWQNLTNAKYPDGSASNANLPGAQTTNYLKATGFGFSVTATAAICGIEVRVERRVSGAASKDTAIMLVKNNVVTGINQKINIPWSTTLSVITYGSNSDLWGTTWTPTDINDPNFGAAISVVNTFTTTSYSFPLIDYITVKVYYSTSTGIESYTEMNSAMTISPNFFNDFATINFNRTIENAELNMYNMSGQKIKTIKNISGKTITLNRDNLSNGIYFMRLTEDNKIIATNKLVITD